EGRGQLDTAPGPTRSEDRPFNGRRREEAQPYDRAGGRGGKGKMKALAVTAGIVFWTLVLGIAWLAFFPGSESSGHVGVLKSEPATAPGAGEPAEVSPSMSESAPTPPSESKEKPAAEGFPPAAEAQPPAPGAQTSGSNVDLPSGFAVAGPSGQPQA